MSFRSFDFGRSPFLVIWEVTQACPLACRHCRAEARELRDPGELTTAEGKALLDQVRAMGTPVCVLSGGDPLKRPDLAELVRHGSAAGLRMATIPAASQDLTRERLVELKEAGLAQIAFSLDGPTALKHDTFRQVVGTFDKTMQAVAWAHELELPLQINSTFTRDTFDDADAMIALVRALGIVFWEVFSLVPTGRGEALAPMTAEQHEALFEKLDSLSKEVRFIIKVTEAPHYRRFVLERRAVEHTQQAQTSPAADRPHIRPIRRSAAASAIPAQLSREMSTGDSFGQRQKGINAGKGFCFVSHMGQVFPSGFLPIPVGNVRSAPLAALYRESPLMLELRDASRLGGRCGICEYADVCGGSRARAYAMTGDYLAEDSTCLYQPSHAAALGD
jgi:radical SAM protein